MITALSVYVPPSPKGIERIFRRFRRDKIDVEVKSARGVSVKHLTYTSYSGELRLDYADKSIGSQRSRLLCSDRLIFPKGSGYRRFVSRSFTERLCTNMALSVLDGLRQPEKIRLGIFDPDASATDFLLRSLKYCSSPVVVTDNTARYSLTARRALDELGAAVFITRGRDELKNSDFIISTGDCGELPPLSREAIVLCTSGKDCSGNVYGKYCFRMPNGFDRLRPSELDEEYFCSALYSLGSQWELGSIIPLSCVNRQGSQTVQSIRARFEEFEE